MTKIKRLFVDIETSPNVGYFWSAGYDLRVPAENIIQERAIVCIAWKWQGEAETQALTWTLKGRDDRAMLKKFIAVLQQADEVVAHNGARFDVKWIRTRALKHGLPLFRDIKLVDTLKIAWSKFKFNASTLDYLASFLGIPGKHHAPFSLWKGVMNGDKESLDRMVAYCRNDVEVLEKVYDKLIPAMKPATHAAVFDREDGTALWACPRCDSTNVRKSKTRTSPSGALQHQMLCTDCGEYYTISNTAFQKYLKAKGRK